MNILFVLPYHTTRHYKRAHNPCLSYQPLHLATLAALVPGGLGAGITLADEGVQRFDHRKVKYDLVCISLHTPGAPRGYELADWYREQGSYVALVGYHVTLLPREASFHADTVFTGPTEVTFPRFLEDYTRGRPQPRYDALAFAADRVPLPRRDLLPKGYCREPTILADHGCPHRCAFCHVHDFWGNRARRPVQAVVEEIRKTGAREWIFLDPSPYSDPEYTGELLEALAKLKISWVGMATQEVAAFEGLLGLLQKSGCRGLGIGFESFCQEDLEGLGKTVNRVEHYKTTVEKLHSHGIGVMGTFLLGLDSDTPESLAALPERVDQIGIDLPYFAILTPWPDTPLFRKLESQHRILHRDWGKYDGIHCVFRPQSMTAEELEQAHRQVWQEAYSSSRIRERLARVSHGKRELSNLSKGLQGYGRSIKGLL